ncbi:prolyl oligopeptidase family serine peptidase [Carboxylicivirga sp. N1Y90]|uniref:S9 family peptidase n=1 Tax=Carboxylicivirga fragile TaxID=3417571 RepID=UPI003D334632|nr:S9 family peptidase [Marinilabiliaceae bacterium N1Y90]
MHKLIVRILLLACLSWTVVTPLMADGKKKMDHTIYDSWKSLDREFVISDDGQFISYVIKPQEGDTYLYIYNVQTQKLDSIPRGKKPVFSKGGSFLAFNVLAQADSVRALKLKKVKKDKMPKDSLFVKNLSTGEFTMVAGINKWSAPKDGGDWLAYMLDKEAKKREEPKDSAVVEEETKETLEVEAEETEEEEGSKLKAEKEEKKEEKKDKKKKPFKSKGKPMVFYRPSTGDSIYIEKVSFYSLAENGNGAYVVQSVGDTTEVSKVLKFDPESFTVDTVFNEIGKVNKISAAYNGEQCAFLFSGDTAKTKVYRLYHYGLKMVQPAMVMDTIHSALPAEWSVSTKGKLFFSRNGERLFFGAGVRPKEEPKDTLTADEKAHVDVWNWKDKEIQPMQKKNLSKSKDPAYTCVYHIKDQKIVQLANEQFKSVDVPDKGNATIGFSYDSEPYKRAQSWNAIWASDVYKIDISSGKKTLLINRIHGRSKSSYTGSWFVYFEPADGQYYSINTVDGQKRLITPGITVSFSDELQDMPNEPSAYGIMGFSNDDRYVLVYDRYDIWQLDLLAKKAPKCLTDGLGRKSNTSYRYIQLNKEEKGINLKKDILLKAFNDVNKKSGYSKLAKGELNQIIFGDYSVYTPSKAKNADVYMWRKSTYTDYPEIRVSDASYTNEKIISNTNPQQKDYIWGDIQLVDWIASDGLTHQGLLIVPENLDKSKKYPMVSYFYERYSDNLHGYRSPAPSRSTVNWNFYASNGYVIFVPDIFYRDGDPGLCAYEAIVSGCLAMADRFEFIDRENMGIQGQSWGGYQVAHLVTRTNLFKAGMAGAPVSNMTSAYGGIRWGSGMSRMFQYEHTQSRIGGTLWEKTNKYIENSPVFFAPQVETPLLMMHNDNDGAVPWYQGIEYFMALRRLDKPVWMLVYNKEEHNLTRRANSKDLSRRMMQFFDHYLKDAPMPVWMHEGVPAVKKGKETGYELVD